MAGRIQTGWVKPPFQRGGLDHLGAQAPCIQIYGQLLPGITNVTDRARYYSFYPWLFTVLEKQGWVSQQDSVTYFRRADCLFTIISIWHAKKTDESSLHYGASIGINTLWDVVQQLSESGEIRLSDYAHQNNESSRYFMNAFGGMGQYYFGVLAQLRLMSGDTASLAQVTDKLGLKLALAMGSVVPEEAFVSALRRDLVTAQDLDDLSSFCHCCLSENSDEGRLLTELLGRGWQNLLPEDEGGQHIEEHLQNEKRGHSLGLLIHLVSICSKFEKPLDLKTFRAMIYTQSDIEGHDLSLPSSLKAVLNDWQVYQRNELLAVALQGLFFAMLTAAQMEPDTSSQLKNSGQLSSWFWSYGPGKEVLEGYSTSENVNGYFSTLAADLPGFHSWQTDRHEVKLAEALSSLSDSRKFKPDNLKVIVLNSLTILSAVAYRPENEAAYEDVNFREGYLEAYPVNLDSVRAALLGQLAVKDLPTGLASFTDHFCLKSHRHVAMRKLRQQGQDTSLFDISESGLRFSSDSAVPGASNTSPRVNQAMQILRDLNLIEFEDGKAMRTTAAGLQFLESIT